MCVTQVGGELHLRARRGQARGRPYNFTNTPATTYELDLDRLDQEGRFLEILRAVSHAPAKLRPGATSEAITEAAAGRLAAIALSLRSRGLDPHRIAHFLDPQAPRSGAVARSLRAQ